MLLRPHKDAAQRAVSANYYEVICGRALCLIVGIIYLTNQARTVYGGDAGDFVASIAVTGIAHPPGYPLYTLLGIIASKAILFQTVAWRIALLSSLPAAVSVILLYDLFLYLSKNKVSSLIAASVFAFLYPVWLYASVVEVFALNNFFTVFLLWLMFHFNRENKVKYLYLAFFILGLSLTHHHLILFLIPTLFYLFYKSSFGNSLCHPDQAKRVEGSSKLRKLEDSSTSLGMTTVIFRVFLLFIAGLVPYLYVLLAAGQNPAVNWMGSSTLADFWALVTRAGYGSFVAGNFISHEPYLRLLDIWAFLDFFYKDFRLLGIILVAIGIGYSLRRDKTVCMAILIAVFSYLFFLFYASFPLVENFLVGTFERFIQPLYIFFTFFILYGIVATVQIMETLIIKISTGKKNKLFVFMIYLLLFIYPAGILFINYPKISIIKNDFTAENLGYNILASVEKNAVLIISTDTPLFNTQSVYYTEKNWPEVKLIHLTKLFTPYYMQTLQKHYPDLVLPADDKKGKALFEELLVKNYPKYPIYSKLAFSTDSGFWVPWGLLFRYYQKKDLPSDQKILEENLRLWSLYDDPLEGSLSKFKNLMLSDNLRIYATARQEFGFWAGKRGFNQEAESFLLEAGRLYPDDTDTYVILAQVYLSQKKCDRAGEIIDKVFFREKDSLDGLFLASLNYAVCFKDPEKASYYQKLYEEKSRNKETPLKKL